MPLKTIAIVEDFCSICDEPKRVMAIPRDGYYCKKCINKAFNGQLEDQEDEEQA